MTTQKQRDRLNRAVEKFNAKHPIGSPVTYLPILPGAGEVVPAFETVTRSEAWVMGDHSVVVMIDGKPGGVSVDHIRPRKVDAAMHLAPVLEQYPQPTMAKAEKPAKKHAVLHSSDRMNWGTPTDLFQAIDQLFHFTLDAAAEPWNAKVSDFFTEEDDALTQDWGKNIVWLNPPYGRGIKKWVAKTYMASLEGAIAVSLIPARTGTNWWWDWVMEKASVFFVRGRLNFELPTGEKTESAPFDSAIVVYWPGPGTHPEKQRLEAGLAEIAATFNKKGEED